MKIMKKANILFIFLFLALVITGCGESRMEKASQHLIVNQTNEVTVVVFSNKKLEDSFTEKLQKNIEYINNNFRIDKPITNVSFINVKEDQEYNYENIFDLKTYPQIFLFEKKSIVLETSDSDEIVSHYKEMSGK